MHPFSLNKAQQENVTGGLQEVQITEYRCENGGPIRITMAIPEDGKDPLPPLKM
ncbi:hypothetical protein [Pseudoalteromonas sp. R3]|uniref:hypothetical protein n=1 Tax=Pseudoalteromonas sp. R3 TaxID=1709477 RepID=UPI000B0CD21D|nr:hypothetical protein [Pseudoalteromonas sp. R3]